MSEDLEDELGYDVVCREPLYALSSFFAVAKQLTVDIMVRDVYDIRIS